MYKFLIGALALISFSSLSDGIVTGKIKGYVINTAAVYVQIDGVISNPASCNATNRFVFKMDQTYSNAFLSSILSAHATGTDVILTGTGSCTISANSETLRKICTPGVPC